MSDAEQLALLKQGVEVWNEWRKSKFHITIDLSKADFDSANLRKANFRGANLRLADLAKADLRESDLVVAKLSDANLVDANLSDATLYRAMLPRTDLHGAVLHRVNLSQATLYAANLSESDLRKADLRATNLLQADLSGANLSEANLLGAQLGNTVFNRINFSTTLGLEKTKHSGPSILDRNTLQLSMGGLSDSFLRGCGFPDWEIESAKLFNPSLTNEEINKILYKIYDLRASQAIQISPLFISYSHDDTDFVDKLESQLNKKGIRFWRDVHDAKAGRLETQIDRAIQQNPTLLLVISSSSMKSDWVEHEVRTARELEKEMARDVLCPVALDDSWKSSRCQSTLWNK